MNLRKIIPQPGMKGWAVCYNERPLPDGMKDREPVTVISRPSGNSITLVGADGRMHKLSHACVDCGYEHLAASGQWVHENSEEGRAITARHLKYLKVAINELDDTERVQAIADWEWRLRRWRKEECAMA